MGREHREPAETHRKVAEPLPHDTRRGIPAAPTRDGKADGFGTVKRSAPQKATPTQWKISSGPLPRTMGEGTRPSTEQSHPWNYNHVVAKYEAACPTCSWCGDVAIPIADYSPDRLTCPEGHQAKRLYRRAPLIKQMVHDHYNKSLGRGVSGMKDFREGLKRKSAQDAERLGMDVQYEPIDPGDHEACGVNPDEIAERRAKKKSAA